MKIRSLFEKKKTVISLEVFPPKKDTGTKEIYDTLTQLKSLSPDFISVTYSAGGSGGTDITFDIASFIKNTCMIEALPHLTCIQATPEEIDRCVKKLLANGIENIMALRGDMPPDTSPASSHYRYAKDMITHIRQKHGDFCIGAAAYPEGHLEADSFEQSLFHLNEKANVGADFFVTQLFFDNSAYYRFLEQARKTGISIPISAGIMPILGRSQIEKMIFMCGVSLPAQIIRILNKYENDPKSLIAAGVDYSGAQIDDLVSHGVDGVHIYTMNRPQIGRQNIERMRKIL